MKFKNLSGFVKSQKWAMLVSPIVLLSSCNSLKITPTDVSLTVAVITASVTITGWFVNEFIRKRSEDKRKRTEEQAKFLERQIEQFYGPLFSLVNQIVICNHVLFELNYRGNKRNETEKGTIINYFHSNYFAPLHDEFNAILKNKLYLIDGSELPESFYTYLKHALQENVQLTLWNNFKIDTSDVKGIPYPDQLFVDLKTGLDNAMKKYAELTSYLDKKKRSDKIKKADDTGIEIRRFSKEELV